MAFLMPVSTHRGMSLATAPARTNTTAMRLVTAAGILAVVGGVLSVSGGSPLGWVAIIGGFVIAGVAAFELRRPRP